MGSERPGGLGAAIAVAFLSWAGAVLTVVAVADVVRGTDLFSEDSVVLALVLILSPFLAVASVCLLWFAEGIMYYFTWKSCALDQLIFGGTVGADHGRALLLEDRYLQRHRNSLRLNWVWNRLAEAYPDAALEVYRREAGNA